jgi:hypothetical protein
MNAAMQHARLPLPALCLALLACITPPAQARLEVEGSVYTLLGAPGHSANRLHFGVFSNSQGAVSDGGYMVDAVHPPTEPLENWADTGAQAYGWAQYGRVGVQVGATTAHGSFVGTGWADSDVRAAFFDTLTVAPVQAALFGTPGVLRYSLVVSGNNWLRDQSNVGWAEVAFTLQASGLPVLQQGQWTSGVDDIGQGSYHGPQLPWILQLEVPFRFGLPFGIAVELSAQTDIVSQGGSLETLADLSHTAAWGGVVELRDAVGSVLGAADYDLTSASGVDYRVAVVPEVPALPLLLAGLLVLGFRLHALPGTRRQSIAVTPDM